MTVTVTVMDGASWCEDLQDLQVSSVPVFAIVSPQLELLGGTKVLGCLACFVDKDNLTPLSFTLSTVPIESTALAEGVTL